MKTLKDDNCEAIPRDVQNRMDKFIDSLANYSWYEPNTDLKKIDVDKQAKLTLECFGVEAEIEYRALSKPEDFKNANECTKVSALNSEWTNAKARARICAYISAIDSNRDSSLYGIWDGIWYIVWDNVSSYNVYSAFDSACASIEYILQNKKTDFNTKYPNGAFIQLLKLWDMGLCPVGVLKETNTFVIYADTKAKYLFSN